MQQTELLPVDAVEASASVLRIWPNRDLAREYFDKHLVEEATKKELRSVWMDAWFVDLSVVCSPNPGKMGIAVYARSAAGGNVRYAEYAGEGNAAIAIQIAAERAATLAMSKGMNQVVLRANAKFLESKLGAPKEADRVLMPSATELFFESKTHRFIWTPDGETGMKVAKEMALASLTP